MILHENTAKIFTLFHVKKLSCGNATLNNMFTDTSFQPFLNVVNKISEKLYSV